MSIKKVIKTITLCVTFAVGVMSFGIPAQAAIIGTSQMGGDTSGYNFDQKIMQQKRGWIQAQLESSGVSRADSVLRVGSLSDNQVIQIHQRMDKMPAGAGAAGVILTVFIVFVITDLIGATDIFPFIRPMPQH